MRSFSTHRRRWLLGAAGLAAGVGGWRVANGAKPLLWNPCRAMLPPALAHHPVVQAAWQGVATTQAWDCHVHIAGIGDSASGITTAPEMHSLASPLQFAQRLFYLNAGCVHDAPGRVDASYVERMLNLIDGLRPGAKLMLFAFDRAYDEAGLPQPARTAFHVPNTYARELAQRHPAAFEWVCSVHPYRADAVAALEDAAAHGARAVKWLPSAMGIDPAAKRCDDFYAALNRLGLPLIVHAGSESAVHGAGRQDWNNPLRLRRPLDGGVRVVVAHCATTGRDVDLDAGENGPVLASFELFARLMAEPRYRSRLFADISAITQRNRPVALIQTILGHDDWHERLLNGSDYPLPGVMPLFAPTELANAGLLAAETVPVLDELQGINPLLFDFVLKRHLRFAGRALPATIFETRRFFDRKSA